MSSRGIALRMQSAQQVAVGPPTFALRVNLPDQIHFSYERYLINSLRHGHGFAGSPIRLLFRKAVGRGAGRAGRAHRRR
jgi:GTP-binding protein